MYLSVLFYIVFLTPNRYEGWQFTPKLIPIYYTIERIHNPTGQRPFLYLFEYWGNIFGNIFLFLPFGFLLSYLYPMKPGKNILLYGLLSSISIELVQFLLQIGVCDIDDVILNTTGVFIGIRIYRYWRKQTKSSF